MNNNLREALEALLNEYEVTCKDFTKLAGVPFNEPHYNSNPIVAAAKAALKEDGWVDVNDRLPELPPPYKEDGALITPITSRCIVWDEESVYEESFDKNGFDNKDITHWRCFPQPPTRK